MNEIELLGVTTVADIEPTSRLGTGANDRAIIEQMLFPVSPLAESDLSGFATDASVELSADGFIARIRRTVEVTPTAPDEYHVSVLAPPVGSMLVKNGQARITIVLPAPAVYPSGPIYEVSLRSATMDPVPVIHGAGGLPAIGDRITVSWVHREDPEVDVDYWYRMIRGGR